MKLLRRHCYAISWLTSILLLRHDAIIIIGERHIAEMMILRDEILRHDD